MRTSSWSPGIRRLKPWRHMNSVSLCARTSTSVEVRQISGSPGSRATGSCKRHGGGDGGFASLEVPPNHDLFGGGSRWRGGWTPPELWLCFISLFFSFRRSFLRDFDLPPLPLLPPRSLLRCLAPTDETPFFFLCLCALSTLCNCERNSTCISRLRGWSVAPVRFNASEATRCIAALCHEGWLGAPSGSSGMGSIDTTLGTRLASRLKWRDSIVKLDE